MWLFSIIQSTEGSGEKHRKKNESNVQEDVRRRGQAVLLLKNKISKDDYIARLEAELKSREGHSRRVQSCRSDWNSETTLST